jgi:hypothetical protein
MDNALDGRLRRLEAGQVAQGEQLAELVAGQERLHDAILRARRCTGCSSG